MYLQDCKKHLVKITKDFVVDNNVSTPILDIFCEKIIDTISNNKVLTDLELKNYFYKCFLTSSEYSSNRKLFKSNEFYQSFIKSNYSEETYWVCQLLADFSTVLLSLYVDWYANLSKKDCYYDNDPYRGFNLSKINKYYGYLVNSVSYIYLYRKNTGDLKINLKIKYDGRIQQVNPKVFAFMINEKNTGKSIDMIDSNYLNFFECFRSTILKFYLRIGNIDKNFWMTFVYTFTDYFINLFQNNIELDLH